MRLRGRVHNDAAPQAAIEIATGQKIAAIAEDHVPGTISHNRTDCISASNRTTATDCGASARNRTHCR